MANEQLCWFHGKITREEADELIKQEGNEDGTFLVRESSSAIGDFVLTVLFQDEVWHYQIRRHGEDAFFSIDDKIKILHGLDTLVEFYKQAANGLVTPLKNHIKKDPPPNDTRSHGVSNLLHRATKENNEKVVSELLKCNYRNIDAKNQDGQTAVHIAAQYCDEPVLKLLLDAHVNVNSMDSIGNMPLHYACRNKSPAFIRILLEANANVQGRNIKNGFVPLHEAAKYGNLEAIQELLAAHAPLLPRTDSGEFPIDLAKESGHDEVVSFLQNYKLPTPLTFQSKWYHGTLSRDEAIEALKNFAEKMENGILTPASIEQLSGLPSTTTSSEVVAAEQGIDTSGCFLVRYSERKGAGTGYVLTMLWNKNVKHFIISQSSKYLYIDNGPYLPTLDHLIEHFMRFSDGLPINLKYPVPPKPKPPLPLFSTMPRSQKRSTSESPIVSPQSPPEHFPTKPPKGEQMRKHSLDAQKLNEIDNERNAQTLTTPSKKKQKENSSSVFSTLRLRSPKKSIDSLRKKSKNASNTNANATNSSDNVIDAKTQMAIAESLLKDLTFSTEFSKLNKTKDENELQATEQSLSGGSLPNDGFYNVPRNNSAVTSPVPECATIEEKTEAEVEYFTKSDIEIQREREQKQQLEAQNNVEPTPPPPPIKTAINSTPPSAPTGYIPTVDVRVFNDPILGEFIQEVSNTPFAEMRGNFKYPNPNRIDSILSTISNESAVNRFLNRQGSNISTTQNSQAYITQPNYFLPPECLELDTIIGEGEFGSVYKGRLRYNVNQNTSNTTQTQTTTQAEDETEMYFDCAIKTLRDEYQRVKEFLREASVMIHLQHHCIVQLYGISKGENLMMVQELVSLGSMLHYILENQTNIKPKYELKLWASQIACGMQYLESQHFVHRDLAARNILLASRHQAKISDFGLSRALGSGNDCYQASQGGKWPIKWYAPESFNNGLFSHASDVWSFGVTLWEMFSLGQAPYGELRGVEAIQLIESGERLPQSKHCPDNIYEIMKSCWYYKPKDRPTFRFLTDFFANDYENILELIKTKSID